MLSLSEYAVREEELLLGMMERFCLEGEFVFDRTLRLRNVRYFHAHPEYGKIWLLEVDGALCGYVAATVSFSFEFGGRDSFIDEIYLEPNVRRRGLGREAVGLVERELRRIGVRQLHLEADLENPGLKPFYESCGFVERGYRLFSRTL